jgi:hypothetical protein
MLGIVSVIKGPSALWFACKIRAVDALGRTSEGAASIMLNATATCILNLRVQYVRKHGRLFTRSKIADCRARLRPGGRWRRLCGVDESKDRSKFFSD